MINPFRTSLSRFTVRFLAGVLLVVAMGALSSVCSPPAFAQLAGSTNVGSTMPPPPAFAIATRLAAQHDYTGAIRRLNDVTSSATYKNTPYAPEAVYSIAHIYEDDLKDDNTAMTSFNTLVNNYSNTPYQYPHKSVIAAERKALGTAIDRENRAESLNPIAHVPHPTSEPWSPLVYLWDLVLATGYIVVDFFVRLTGSKNYSYWFALLLISILVRLGLWPLSTKQYKSMKEMQKIQPLMKDLQAKYKNDKQTLATKQMELYKEHKINPAAGCLPMIMQFPVFIYMYHAVWLYQYRFSHGTFLWITPSIHSLAPSIFGANLADQDIVLLALYAVSMYVTQRMMPVTDPQQAEMMKSQALMSAVLFFVLFQNYHFPSAFVLYWFFSNVVSSLVQIYVMRQRGLLPAGSVPATVAGQMLDGDNSTSNPQQGLLNGSGGNGASPRPERNGADSGAGTARGMIAPKVHPKKKRR